MSQPKFTPMTASLLARKGNAMPSAMTAFGVMPKVESPPRVFEQPIHVPPLTPPPMVHSHADHDAVHIKKLFVPLTHPEHERLSIAAVKTGLTRHQLVRDALETYFEQLSRDMGHECRCVSGATCMKTC